MEDSTILELTAFKFFVLIAGPIAFFLIDGLQSKSKKPSQTHNSID